MASKSLNRVMLIGNATRDPELRYTPQGSAVTTFGLATNRSWKTEAGEVREEAEFHRLVAWNKLAEICSQLITKGRKVYVEGRLQTRSWTGTADNLQHTVTEIIIDDMILLDSRPMGSNVSNMSNISNKSNDSNAAGDETNLTNDAGKASTDDKTKDEKKEEKKEKKEAKKKAETTEGETGKENVDVEDIPF